MKKRIKFQQFKSFINRGSDSKVKIEYQSNDNNKKESIFEKLNRNRKKVLYRRID